MPAEWGSDVAVEMMKAYGIKYAPLNLGGTYRGLLDSIVNFGGNQMPEVLGSNCASGRPGCASPGCRAPRECRAPADPGRSDGSQPGRDAEPRRAGRGRVDTSDGPRWSAELPEQPPARRYRHRPADPGR